MLCRLRVRSKAPALRFWRGTSRGSQPQQLIPERTRPGDGSGGASVGRGEDGGATGEDAEGVPRRRGGEAGGDASTNPLLSFASADSLYRQAREVGGFVTTGSDRCDTFFLWRAYLLITDVDGEIDWTLYQTVHCLFCFVLFCFVLYIFIRFCCRSIEGSFFFHFCR